MTAALRAALLAALVLAGWNIYRRLPGSSADTVSAASGETKLQIVLLGPPSDGGVAMNIPVTLYPVDREAVEREFLSEHRPGERFEKFLKDRMQGRAPVETRLDESGRATVIVTQGQWWLDARLPIEHPANWYLPINVSGREQTIELNARNMAQSF
jgi:hypothetical protein